jgi:hypothetical protein
VRAPLLAVVLLASGCAAPEAPTELSELARYLVREFDHEDPAFLAAGASNLDVLLDGLDLDEDLFERSSVPTHLALDDVADLTRPPGTDLDDTVDVTLAYRSSYGVAEHAVFAVDGDQLSAEPSAVAYERTFLDGDDCFASGACTRLRTVNQVSRQNMLFALDFELWKDFRRAQTEDGVDVLVSRAWTEEGFQAHVGTADLRQSWTLDVFIDDEVGCRRWRVNWAETLFDPPIEDDILRNTTRSSMQDALEAADAALD